MTTYNLITDIFKLISNETDKNKLDLLYHIASKIKKHNRFMAGPFTLDNNVLAAYCKINDDKLCIEFIKQTILPKSKINDQFNRTNIIDDRTLEQIDNDKINAEMRKEQRNQDEIIAKMVDEVSRRYQKPIGKWCSFLGC